MCVCTHLVQFVKQSNTYKPRPKPCKQKAVAAVGTVLGLRAKSVKAGVPSDELMCQSMPDVDIFRDIRNNTKCAT